MHQNAGKKTHLVHTCTCEAHLLALELARNTQRKCPLLFRFNFRAAKVIPIWKIKKDFAKKNPPATVSARGNTTIEWI
jgi:hypothetical protein